jgi:putative ABC transport system substrate-binding protein
LARAPSHECSRCFVLAAASAKEIDDAFTTLAQAHPAAVLIGGDPYLNSARKQLIALAAHQSIPTMYGAREAPAEGGLMSYSISFQDAYRQAAAYVCRVLKGEKPDDMPVIRPTRLTWSSILPRPNSLASPYRRACSLFLTK